MNSETTKAPVVAKTDVATDATAKKKSFAKSMIITACVAAVVLVWKFYFM